MKTLLQFSIIIVLCCSFASAESYNKYVGDIDSCTNFGEDPGTLGNQTLKVNYVDFNFDSALSLLTIEVQTDDSRGDIADLFHFVITDGDMPGGEAHVAHVYFDASDVNNPKANVFAYNGRPVLGGDVNCNNSPGSWTEMSTLGSFGEDTILETSSSAVMEITAVEEVATNTTRTFRLTLHTGYINSYDPIMIQSFGPYPYEYQGLQFGDNIGVWFWAADATSTFNGSGYLDSLSMSVCAMCDEANFETKKKPVCVGSSVSTNPVEVGESTTISITINDPDKLTDTEQNDLTVSYTGLPTGAKPDVPEDGVVSLDAVGNATVNITWVPQDGDEGTYSIGTTFAKDYGLGQLVANCADVEVEAIPKVPECKETDSSPITQADADLNNLNRIASVLKTRIKNLRAKTNDNRAVDNVDENSIYESAWNAYWRITNQGQNYLFECSFTEYCSAGFAQINISDDVSTFRDQTESLKDLAAKRANKFKNALKKHLIENKGYTKQAAKKKAKKKTNKLWLNGKNNDGIKPSYASASSLTDLHVNNYGTTKFECPNALIVD